MRKKNVLLVDDDQISNLLNQKTLQHMGLASEIHVALNGKEAIELINDYYQGFKSMPEIILLDLNMPIMDGFGFIEAFQRLNVPNKGQTLIIIVSSSVDERDIKRAEQLGIHNYLTKPLMEEDLMLVLSQNSK